MAVELIVPSIGESITEVFIGQWMKKEGDEVARDGSIVELESDKATVELPAPAAGRISKILKKQGETAKIGEVIGYLEEGDGAAPAKESKEPKESKEKPAPEKARESSEPAQKQKPAAPKAKSPVAMPAAERVLAEKGIQPDDVSGTGPGGRILKEDVLGHTRKVESPGEVSKAGDRPVEVVPMSPMRRTIAARLVEAQQGAALLTTFNEVDMSAVMDLRKHYQEAFQKKHGIKLGFMSFFVKACVEALRQFPQVNAYIDGNDIVYHNYYDIGVAVSSKKGLVVPVLRNAERMSFSEIETVVADFGARGQENKISLEELEGGTFTISNGGVFGSLLSTPIINPPQSGILGLHAIQDRPVARDGQVVIRPMMYVALTYDHRIVDGREAVTFLKRIKEVIEEPARILIEA